MELLLIPIQFFAFNPIAVFMVTAFFSIPCFLKSYSKRSKTIMGIVTFLFLLYGLEEIYMTHWRSSTGDMAIRIDLVFLGPIISLVTFVGVVTTILGYKRKK